MFDQLRHVSRDPARDLPRDLPRLRTLETWHRLWLARIEQAIAQAEAEQGRRQGAEVAAARGPGWKLEPQRLKGDNRPWRVHVGDCGMGGGRSCSYEQAREALASGVEACRICRPDTALGVLE
jgi:hypothetical protein